MLTSVRNGGKLNTGIPGESLGNLLCRGTCFSNTIYVYRGPCFRNMSRNKFLGICCATCCTTYSYVYGWLYRGSLPLTFPLCYRGTRSPGTVTQRFWSLLLLANQKINMPAMVRPESFTVHTVAIKRVTHTY